MPRNHKKPVVCEICKKDKMLNEVMPAESVRDSVAQIIRERHPVWPGTGFICLADLNHFRAQYVQSILEAEKGELTLLENEVISSLKDKEILSDNINIHFDKQLTFGERVSDKLAEFGGSWPFIISFSCVLIIWIVLNAVVLRREPFDPYPFILLNLVLSCLAAVQAPIIMMSQNRQEAKDRLRAEYDYRVNLKAELEIRILHEKIDHLIVNQWQKLLEIQEIQLELMEEAVDKNNCGPV